MKKILVIGLAALITAGTARAQSFSLSSDVTFATKYVFRGQEVAKNTLHPSVEYSQDAFYAGVWGAVPLEEVPNWTHEFDFYAGYRPKLSDITALDFGITHYYYTNSTAPTNGRTDSSTEVFAGANVTMSGFTPGVYAYYDFDVGDGTYTVLGSLGYSVPMDNLHTTLDLSVSLGGVVPDKGESYSYFGVEASVPFKLSDKASVRFSGGYTKNDLDHVLDDDVLWFTAGLTIGF